MLAETPLDITVQIFKVDEDAEIDAKLFVHFNRPYKNSAKYSTIADLAYIKFYNDLMADKEDGLYKINFRNKE